MYCKLCNTSNEDGAVFCRNCGMKLNLNTQKLENSDPIDKQAIHHLFMYVIFECIITIMWLIFANVFIPIIRKTGGLVESNLVNYYYSKWNLAMSFITIIIPIIFIVITKHPKAKMAFIIALIVRILAAIIPHIISLLNI
jgi:hypothetical protein